ncbi:MAG: RNA polymerase sigma factor [Psychromonas sp.]
MSLYAMIKKYRQFYEDYKTKLFRYLLFRCGDYEIAKDIMQESFTRHYQKSKSSPALSPAFLFTIARNALVDYQRHENNYSLIQDYTPKSYQDLEADLILGEESQSVTDAFNKLAREDREILTLVVSSLSYKKIAEIQDLSEANIKVRVHRARVRLRESINNGEKKWNT